MTDATGSFHIVIASLQEDVEPQHSAEALADAIGLEPDVAAVILRKAPITLFRDVTPDEMDFVRDHLVELSKAGIDFKITRKPVDDLPKVNWPEKPDLRLLFGDEVYEEEADEEAAAAQAQATEEMANRERNGHEPGTAPPAGFEAEAQCPCCQARLKVSQPGAEVQVEVLEAAKVNPLAAHEPQHEQEAVFSRASMGSAAEDPQTGLASAGLAAMEAQLGHGGHEELEGHDAGLTEAPAPLESAMQAPPANDDGFDMLPEEEPDFGGDFAEAGSEDLPEDLDASPFAEQELPQLDDGEELPAAGMEADDPFGGTEDLPQLDGAQNPDSPFDGDLPLDESPAGGGAAEDDLPADLDADPFSHDLDGEALDDSEARDGQVELVSGDLPLPEDAFNMEPDSELEDAGNAVADVPEVGEPGPVDDLAELDTTPEDEERINSMVQSLESGDDISQIPTLEEAPDLPGEEEGASSQSPDESGLTVVSNELQPWSGRARDYKDPNLTKEQREELEAQEAAEAAMDAEEEDEELEPWTGRARDYVDPELKQPGDSAAQEEEDDGLEPWTGRARDYEDPELKKTKSKPKQDTLDAPAVADPTSIELEFADDNNDNKTAGTALDEEDLPELGDDLPDLDEEPKEKRSSTKKKKKKTTKKVKKKTEKTKTSTTKKKSTGKTKRLKKKRKAQRSREEVGEDVLDELGIDLSAVEEEPEQPAAAVDDDPLGAEELDLDGIDLDADEGLSLDSKDDEDVPTLDLKDDLGIDGDLPAPQEEPEPEESGNCTVFLNKIKPGDREKAVQLMNQVVGMDPAEAEQLVGRLVVPVIKDVTEERAEQILNRFQREGLTGRVRKNR